MGALAFDLADRLQTTVFVMLDLDIGMNEWLTEPFKWDDSRKLDRGKVMSAEDLDARAPSSAAISTWTATASRIGPIRRATRPRAATSPAAPRGTPYARYSEEGAVYVDNMQRLLRKFETAKALMPAPVVRPAKGKTKDAVIYLRLHGPAMHEALEMLEARAAGSTPCACAPSRSPTRLFDFIARTTGFVVEQNRDGQLRSMIVNEGGVDPASSSPCCTIDGTPITGPLHRRRGRQLALARPDRGGGMTYILKPQLHHPKLPTNSLGYTRATTRARSPRCCAAAATTRSPRALIQAASSWSCRRTRWPSSPASGCSSKTPDYFLGNSHGFNTVHGRMPSVLTGQPRQQGPDLPGVSGDGFSPRSAWASSPTPSARREHALHRREQRRVRLTKGQFSPRRTVARRSKRGRVNTDAGIDMVMLRLQMGATVRGTPRSRATRSSWSADQGGPATRARPSSTASALRAVQQPRGSTKSFDYVREHNEAVNRLDVIHPRATDRRRLQPGETVQVPSMTVSS
jgi:hypothetical protein